MSHSAGFAGFCLVFSLALAIGAVAGDASAQDDVRAVAEEILADPRYQKSLGKPSERPPPRPSERTRRVRRGDPGKPKERLPPPPGPGPRGPRESRQLDGSVLYTLLVMSLLLMGAFAVMGIIAAIRDRRERDAAIETAENVEHEVEEGAERLSPFEELAAAGDFAGAVHVMLQFVIVHYRDVDGVPVPRSATARELLRRLPCSDEERSGLERLVDAVERSLFGGQTISQSAYQTCLGAYRGLVR